MDFVLSVVFFFGELINDGFGTSLLQFTSYLESSAECFHVRQALI